MPSLSLIFFNSSISFIVLYHLSQAQRTHQYLVLAHHHTHTTGKQLLLSLRSLVLLIIIMHTEHYNVNVLGKSVPAVAASSADVLTVVIC